MAGRLAFVEFTLQSGTNKQKVPNIREKLEPHPDSKKKPTTQIQTKAFSLVALPLDLSSLQLVRRGDKEPGVNAIVSR